MIVLSDSKRIISTIELFLKQREELSKLNQKYNKKEKLDKHQTKKRKVDEHSQFIE